MKMEREEMHGQNIRNTEKRSIVVDVDSRDTKGESESEKIATQGQALQTK